MDDDDCETSTGSNRWTHDKREEHHLFGKREYRPLQFGKRDYRPLQFGKRTLLDNTYLVPIF
ncbi:hypothetical protein DICVIV_00806 [Dictyocaulus viviparus]|uniref:Uncharacterized protein n=1 Tax=Dictyocaulus viviparus TaxID=29172 RepID=A0A0D8Y9Q7_DICVI|nr:hypothetical protein DICVIV_00806 [Dictyocaulus viviparus]